MIFLYEFENFVYKIIICVIDTWMCLLHGEGEKEIVNQGWSRVDSFSQETGAVGQQIPRSGRIEPKLTTVESSAGCTGFSDSTPLFSLSEWSLKTTQRRWTYLLFSHQRSYNYVHFVGL